MLCSFLKFLQNIRREFNGRIKFLAHLYFHERIGIIVDDMVGEKTCIMANIFVGLAHEALGGVNSALRLCYQ